MTTAASEKPSLLHVLMSRRLVATLLLGFSSGIPIGLTGSTLQAWMFDQKVDLSVIGWFSLAGLPYTLKFLWAPLMDRFVPPLLGRRRGWMLLTQLGLVVTILALGFSSPHASIRLTALLALLVTFFSASQDIVIDAYRTDVLEESERGLGASATILGYRLAMLVSGALALFLADHYMNWHAVYATMAATMLVGIGASFWAPEPSRAIKPPRTLTEAVVLPFLEFFKRRGAFEILGFIFLYKLDAVIAVALTTPFMLELGFTKTDIAAVTKGIGLAATILGSFLGGALMVRLGLLRSLWIFGIAQGISGLSFWLLAHVGHQYPIMVLAIAAENICSGMGNAAFLAFIMSICDPRFTATQYALLSSFMALNRVIAAAPMGWVAKTVGWETYYLLSVVAMVPGLLLLTRYRRWAPPADL
jgi:MFS transporter, PAT family, beta-lactamase induction signal transducer AmpG